ncbi:hypothetical protein [uncultured Tenacibaculum sp.]|uniref:hypothetical protein n=1 Tax=uncultured Tenacibaculum sp. TaxID=174713 RepID=UPI002613D458|nr:hypothetical protein [uncultured Tenacibaculum sp.]
MKKSILNLGKALNKAEQRQVQGGKPIICYSNPICPPSFDYCIVYGNKCEYLGGL